MPEFLAPQLATLVSEAPTGDAWLHESKFDGYRILARLDHGRVRLLSRNGRDWTDRFGDVATAVANLPARQAMLDGEVAALLPDGTTSFQALQNMLSGAGRHLIVYMLFDVLHLDGLDLTATALERRKVELEDLLRRAPSADRLRYSDHVIGRGPEFFEEACRLKLEGIVSKLRAAPYHGARSRDWLKVKCVKRQEVVIAGYTDPEGSRVGIGALLAGVYEGDRLVFAGKVGTGFTDAALRELEHRLARLRQSTCPFATRPSGVGAVHWVRPELVGEVAFTEWTADGKLRHPSFQGLREDKATSDVVRERPSSREEPAVKAQKSSVQSGAGRKTASRQTSPPGPSAPIAVASVRLTHPDRVLYSRQGVTKRGLANFYEAIAEWILPHLKDRPTALVRCPEGADGACFYQKHAGPSTPGVVRRVKIREKTKVGEYLVVDSLPALVGLVQMGILEIHTWNSEVADLERPNRLVFDLDPGPGVPWPKMVTAARLIRDRLEAIGLESFVKTTGSKGLHVVTPLRPGPSWDEGSAFARKVAEDLAREDPRGFVAHMAKAAREGRIFVDYLRNVRGATSVAAYSTRARPDAPISTPVGWDELSARLRPDQFTIVNLPKRLARLGADPWARYWSLRQKLPKP